MTAPIESEGGFMAVPSAGPQPGEIMPALTPEEWEAHFDGINYDIGDNDRHFAAAVALEGQPFGFSWADVAELQRAAEAMDRTGVMIGGGSVGDPLRSIAARISALLPPKT